MFVCVSKKFQFFLRDGNMIFENGHRGARAPFAIFANYQQYQTIKDATTKRRHTCAFRFGGRHRAFFYDDRAPLLVTEACIETEKQCMQ